MEEDPSPPEINISNPPKKFDLSLNIIFLGFVLIFLGFLFGWYSTVDQPPESADYSPEKYDELLEKHNNMISTLSGTSLLFTNGGLIILAWGLFYLPLSSNSEHLPEWVRVALVLGAMLFLIRLFTTNISIIDALTLGILAQSN